jgi:hypothetical protein
MVLSACHDRMCDHGKVLSKDSYNCSSRCTIMSPASRGCVAASHRTDQHLHKLSRIKLPTCALVHAPAVTILLWTRLQLSLEKYLVRTMALPAENIRALDQLRQRLQQLSTSLNILKTDLSRQETLPTW